MCRLMGSHFHGWIDYNGVSFSVELLKWGRTFSDLGGKRINITVRLCCEEQVSLSFLSQEMV